MDRKRVCKNFGGRIPRINVGAVIDRPAGDADPAFLKSVDKRRSLCYYSEALRETPSESEYGRVVELVDSLDSGSSVHCGRAGSSPASPTKKKRTSKWMSVSFWYVGLERAAPVGRLV